MNDLRPATAADAAILALHHHRRSLQQGMSEADATRATQGFLVWARAALGAGRLVAVIAGDGLEAVGSAALYINERPEGLPGGTELLHLWAPESLEPDLVHALLDEARLRGIATVNSRLSGLEKYGFAPLTTLECQL